jgi:hypothetical protein
MAAGSVSISFFPIIGKSIEARQSVSTELTSFASLSGV